MNGTINYFYKDGRKMTTRTAAGTVKEVARHAKETLAVYKNAGAASFEILDENGNAVG
jgi:hypothetical protein